MNFRILLGVSLLSVLVVPAPAFCDQPANSVQTQLAKLETSSGGRLDAYAQSDMCAKRALLEKHQLNKEPPQVVLQRFDLPETVYHNAGMSMTTFLPGSMKSRHEHTGPEVGFVLEGELIIKLEGHPAKIIHAGESFQIPMHMMHTTEAGPKGAKVIATWVLKK